MKQKALPNLLDEVEALVKVYVGKNAPSEQWIDTCYRLERIAKLLKGVRKAEAAQR